MLSTLVEMSQPMETERTLTARMDDVTDSFVCLRKMLEMNHDLYASYPAKYNALLWTQNG